MGELGRVERESGAVRMASRRLTCGWVGVGGAGALRVRIARAVLVADGQV